MAMVALVISLFVAVVGATGIVSPMRLFALVRRFQSPAGLYAAAILRVVLGVGLFFAAPASRAPDVVRVLGIVILVSDLITPLVGIERFRKILNGWSARGFAFKRFWAGFALAFGLFLACAVLP